MEHIPPAQFDAACDGQMVATRHRDDGWTAARQREFLESLAACGSVSAAARSVGMSRESAYALRRRSDARGFVQAWDAARAMAVEHLTEVAWDRALNGQVRPVYYHGELMGETRQFDNRLLLALIAQNRAAAGAALPSPALVAAVVEDWDAALDRVERGEALVEAVPPTVPDGDSSGGEAARLEVGCYAHWWDEARGEWLTNWPAPADFAGEELAVDEDDAVIGPYADAAEALDPWGQPIAVGYARTLTPAEAQGLDRAGAQDEAQRAARLDLYRRAAFGLAGPVELASIAAVNGGRVRFGDSAGGAGFSAV